MMIVLWAVGTVVLGFLGGLLGAAYFEYLDKGQREADEIAKVSATITGCPAR